MGTASIERQSVRESDLPQRRLWTREEFERAADLGLFKPGERLELIEGEIIRKVAPMKTPHAVGILLAQKILFRTFGDGYTVRIQLPLGLGKRNEPEPDFAVTVGTERDQLPDHPSKALLIVEVADSTLRLDRGRKARVYAMAGIPEYWIVNVQDRLLEVHRDPNPMASLPLGHHYRSITRLTATDSITPLAAPDSSILVGNLLP